MERAPSAVASIALHRDFAERDAAPRVFAPGASKLLVAPALPLPASLVSTFRTNARTEKARSTPWWLWCNVLSIDAPIVAVVWSELFARSTGGSISWVEASGLALVVWVIYVFDRLLDGRGAPRTVVLKARHLFCRRHRAPLASLLLVAALFIFYLAACHLHAAEMGAALGLAAILALYMACIHLGRSRTLWIFPKEILVGTLFVAGVTLPCWSRSVWFPWNTALPFMLFALLCSLNCLSIECWENCVGDGAASGATDDRPNSLVAWADRRINLVSVLLATAAGLAALLPETSRAFCYPLVAIGGGSVLLLLLNCGRRRLSPPALRVLADAALLLPAGFALVMLGLRG
jgi:hypothetical protein